MPGRSSDTLAVQVPTLGDVMPAYTVAAHVLLPMSTAAAGLVCLLSVLVAPGAALCKKQQQDLMLCHCTACVLALIMTAAAELVCLL
jgi:hypothetical protein